MRTMAQAAWSRLGPGALVAGRYEIVAHLGAGGMGDVYEVEHRLLGRRFALKRLVPELGADAAMVERFLREARAAAATHHPGVVEVIDLGFADEGWPFLVMEKLVGETVRARVRRGPIAEADAIAIAAEVADALGAAHAVGVVHRDIKTGNILVCEDGRVKVTDFGIARAVDEAGTTQTGFLMGTASYLAPELLQGQSASPASDLYALGVVAYECITGHAPFTGQLADVIDAQQREQVPPLPDTVSPALRDLVMALLAKDPAARPADAGAVSAQAQRLGGMSSLSGARLLSDPYPREHQRSDDRETQIFDDAVVPALAGGLTEAPTSYGVDQQRRGPHRALLVALGALAVMALVAAAVLLTIRAVNNGGKDNASPKQSSSPAKAAKPIKVSQATVFSPTGGGTDHPEELPLATDGSKSSAWYTEHYATADFGQLKQGVGLLVQVPADAKVGALTVRFATPGVTAKVYAGDNSSSLLQSKPIATTNGAPSTWRVQPDQPKQATYWLIWISKLAPDDGAYRAGVADLRFTA